MSATPDTVKPILRFLPGRYAVCRLPPETQLREPANGAFFSLTRTADEISIVCREEHVPAGAESEPGWHLLQVEGPLAFSEIGVLAGLAGPLAAAAISIFVVSTWATDYLMVRDRDSDQARRALLAAGYRFS